MSHRALFQNVAELASFDVLGTTATVLARADQTDGTFELFVGDFPQGFVLPPHRHPWAEFYFVLDGTIDVTVGRRTDTATPGHFIHIPPRAVHALATPDRSARALLWTAGGDALHMFDDLAARLPQGPPNEAVFGQIVELTAKYGLEMLVPTA